MPTPLPIVPRYDPRKTRAYAEIDLSALAANARVLTHTVAPDSLMAVVKADAYGHGAVAVSRACAGVGVAHFGVATVDEALTLRQAGIRGDIYLLSAFVPDEAEAIVRGDIVTMLSSPEHFAAIARAARNAPLPARAFVVVDTGMGREGILPETARALWRDALRSGASLRLTGIASHLACADDTEADGTAATRQQSEIFAVFVESVADMFPAADDGRGNRGVWLSLYNSPGTIRRNEWRELPHVPGVRGVLHRAGLSLYGVEPHPGAFGFLPDLRQVLTLKARVTLVRELPTGATIGYGGTHTLTRPSRIATVAIGYADGYPRRLSNRGTAILRGDRFPVVGRVSMDQLQIDATDAREPVTTGDTVTLLGDGIETLAFADSIGATAHEPTCYLTSRVPRLYTNIPQKDAAI